MSVLAKEIQYVVPNSIVKHQYLQNAKQRTISISDISILPHDTIKCRRLPNKKEE